MSEPKRKEEQRRNCSDPQQKNDWSEEFLFQYLTSPKERSGRRQLSKARRTCLALQGRAGTNGQLLLRGKFVIHALRPIEMSGSTEYHQSYPNERKCTHRVARATDGAQKQVG